MTTDSSPPPDPARSSDHHRQPGDEGAAGRLAPRRGRQTRALLFLFSLSLRHLFSILCFLFVPLLSASFQIFYFPLLSFFVSFSFPGYLLHFLSVVLSLILLAFLYPLSSISSHSSLFLSFHLFSISSCFYSILFFLCPIYSPLLSSHFLCTLFLRLIFCSPFFFLFLLSL